MREVPCHIAKALHDKDPDVNIHWDQDVHRWALTWKNQRICTLFHEDGSDMIELCLDEITSFLDRFDNRKNGPERVNGMRAVAANARRKALLRAELEEQESLREAERVHRNMVNGCPAQEYFKRQEIVTC